MGERAGEELPARFVDAASEGDGAAASFEEEEELPPTLEDQAGDLALGIANLFPLWLALVAGAVLARPQLMTWFHREWLTHGLSVTMLSMGMTLTLEVRPPVAEACRPADALQVASGCSK